MKRHISNSLLEISIEIIKGKLAGVFYGFSNELYFKEPQEPLKIRFNTVKDITMTGHRNRSNYDWFSNDRILFWLISYHFFFFSSAGNGLSRASDEYSTR